MNLKLFLTSFFFITLISCKEKPEDKKPPISSTIEETNEKVEGKIPESDVTLDLMQANRLAALPFKCIQSEYPNKTGQILSDSTDLGTPRELHPAFYGCFDWHSSVHGHWSLVKLLKSFPELENRDTILIKIKENLSKANIQKEIKYFERTQEYSYERMYGWSWLLKLQSELDTWETKDGKLLATNLKPLSDLIVKRYIDFLPKLNYPLREGMHGNTAFGLGFAYDYSKQVKDEKLRSTIEETARRLYLKDKNYPIEWEPNGFDFLSPGLEEINLMHRVLPRDEFTFWIEEFMPQLKNPKFTMKPAEVSDRTDGHLVHLDGLNFSRAWVFYRLAKEMPNEYGHLKTLGDKHLAYSLSKITDVSYEGEHWLATFALYALSER